MLRFYEAKSIGAVFTTAGRVTEAARCDQQQTITTNISVY